MARPIWTGSLGFGLVNVPVSLYAATQDKGVQFHQLEAGTGDRIRYRKVNERTGEEVRLDRIVRGVDLGNGEYAVVEDAELDAIAPERSKVIEIIDFVDLAEIDPVYYETTYYLAPRGDAAARAYALLRAAMAQTQRVGIALFVMRGRERVVAVRPERSTLAMETMYFADEVRDPSVAVPDLPADAAFEDRELRTACMLIESLSTAWSPARYQSTYRQALEDLIERKRHGETVRASIEEPEHRAQIVDLMEALNASLEASRGTRGPRDGGADAPAEVSPTRRVGTDGRRRRPSPSRPPQTGRVRTAASERRRRDPQVSVPQPDIATMTKAELAARAAELDVPGRSRMTRGELADAVRRVTRRRAS